MNSQQYDFSSDKQDPSTTSDDKLYSSQPEMKACEISGEPCPRTTVVDSPFPTVPPRNYLQASRTPMTNSPYPYNSYGQYPYSFRSPYNSYSYGYNSSYPHYSGLSSGMFGGYGMNGFNVNNPDSRFIRAAADNSRSAFQAVETMTRAVNSLAFMMESTFGSLSMSFQAILSVIENFSQARKFLKQVITSILTLRIFHKFLSMLVNLLRRMNILSEQAVASLRSLQPVSESTSMSTPMWPILTFFGLMFGAPYIISKMFPCHEEDSQPGPAWNPSTDRSIPLVAVHDFKAGTDQELSVVKGQSLKMVPPEIMPPRSPYWVFVADERNQTGFVPRNHVAPTS